MAQEGASFFAARSKVIYKATEVKILKFFWEAFELVSHKLTLYLQDPLMKYIITGHSLGGALASILAMNTTLHVSLFMCLYLCIQFHFGINLRILCSKI